MGRQCNCDLNEETEGRYSGSLDSNIMIIGESPEFKEIKTKSGPFTGDSGDLLRKELKSAGLHVEDIFFGYSVRCYLDKKSLSAGKIKEILRACRPNIETAIHHVQPKIIVLCGALALEQVFKRKGIKKHRGKFFESSEFNCIIYPIWHPAYILRNNNMLSEFQGDIRRLVSFIANGYEVKKDNLVYKEVDTIRPLLNGYLMKGDGSFDHKMEEFPRTPILDQDQKYATAIDTETQGLDWTDPNSITISYSVSINQNEGWNIILHEEVPVDKGDFNIAISRGGTKKAPTKVEIGIKRVRGYERKISELRELCSNPNIKKYFMNQKYDVHRLENLGVTVIDGPIMDVALAAHVLDSERWTNASLGDLMEGFTNLSSQHKGDFNEEEKSDMLLQLKKDRKRFNRYASYDSIATLRVALAVRKQLFRDEESLNYYVNFVQPVEGEFLYSLERTGVLVDKEKIPVVKKEIKSKMRDFVDEFIKLCPEDTIKKHEDKGIKLTRRIILTDALFKYTDPKDGSVIDTGHSLNPIDLSPKSGMPVCDKTVCKKILESSAPEKVKRLINVYQEWSEFNTLLTRYINNIEKNVGPDGRLHPTYSFTYTSSGRTGARNPSIQNFPKRSKVAHYIRRLLVAPPGKVFLDIDYCTSELRWIAHRANERAMKKVFDEDGDIHMRTGLELSKYDREEDIPAEEKKPIRQNAKAVNFGFVYGMSAFGFQEYAYVNYGLKLNPKKANEWKIRFFRLYPDIVTWHEESKEIIETQGYIRHAFGRKRVLKNILSYDDSKRKEAIRVGINFEIQGPSSDATLMAGHHMQKDEEFDQDECKVVIFTHDSLSFEVDEDKVGKYYSMAQKYMENIDTKPYGFELSVRLKVEGEIGPNLAEMQKYKPENVRILKGV